MHPILFEIGSITVYTYGFCIALGAVLAFTFMYVQARKAYSMSFDQANTLFLLLVVAAVAGGKLFLFFESPTYYLEQPKRLLSGSGFVFYGSLLCCIPTMLWYFKRCKLPIKGMLDIMAMVTCIVHGFGRLGCFNAGCCHGTETDFFLGVVFTDERCQAPLNTQLHPVQLYEAGFIFLLLATLWFLSKRKQFEGQVFLVYLMAYSVGRAVLELFRGDEARGFVVGNWLSHSQGISILVFAVALFFYIRLRRNTKLGA